MFLHTGGPWLSLDISAAAEVIENISARCVSSCGDAPGDWRVKQCLIAGHPAVSASNLQHSATFHVENK